MDDDVHRVLSSLSRVILQVQRTVKCHQQKP